MADDNKKRAAAPSEDEKKPKLRKTHTMAETQKMADELLKKEGHKQFKPLSGDSRPMTRSQHKKRETVEEMLSSPKVKPGKATKEEIEEHKNELRMAFRLFDEKKEGKIKHEQLVKIIKSLGKKPRKEKIQDIIDNAEEGGYISMEAFVQYMVEKKYPEESKTPKKRGQKSAAEKKAEEDEKKEEEEEEEDDDDSGKPAVLKKGSSILNFYNPVAGLHDEINAKELDEHANPKGREYDLGIENAFSTFSIILYNFNDRDPGMEPKELLDEPVKALKNKGFHVHVAKDENDFLEHLHDAHQAWFTCSNYDNMKNSEKFVAEIIKFHESGKGLCIFGENHPYYHQANLVLPKLLGITLEGNDYCGKVLNVTKSDKTKAGEFSRDLITTGIVKIYEGVTICRPSKVTVDMKVIGMSTAGHPCFFSSEPAGKGRLFVDCGFTKLYPKYWNETAGTGRFVRNIAVWLLGLENF